jgi:hypothetical protein
METDIKPNHTDVKGFYTFVAIVAFAIVVLQPLAMLAAMFVQAINQTQ